MALELFRENYNELVDIYSFAIVLLLELVDAVFITHVLLHLSMSPSVSHYGWLPDLLVPRSKPHIRPSPLPVHRHGTSLLDLHLAVDHRLQAPHLCTTSKTHVAQPNSRHSSQIQPENTSHVDNHSSYPNHKSTYCSQNNLIHI